MNGGDQIARGVGAIVDSGALANAATMVWRDGKVVQRASLGWRDLEARLPLEHDSLFRIASMTKPITSTAALMLFEEGRFALTDPIARWAPEFRDMRVLRSPTGPLDETDPAERPITFEDLLTHRSGLTYGAFHRGPIAEAYGEALGGDIDSHVAPDDWITRLAALPLLDQPGATLHYGHSTDLLGLLIARIEDAPLGDVLKRRIFDPLGMADTSFIVPREKRDRRVKNYGFDGSGRLSARLTCPGDSTVPERPDDMDYVSGGQGLWSTLDDYLAFARIFLGAGAVDGVRILRPETLVLMTSNRLTEQQRATAEVGGMPLFRGGHGFGMGVAVVLDPKKAEPTVCGGREGAVGWPGGFGGWWRADANDDSVLIFLAHNMVERDQLSRGIGLGVYEAITQFQALASADDRRRPHHSAAG
ncbi:serine hydrolase domain-containing protein [Sorangium sp. So ce363]|uniref:serine hydrolase domain-containing protein n=1 Tax=Sorangium sp. So ce363 TaxID=3133304 RepID=UPI003F5FAFE1